MLGNFWADAKAQVATLTAERDAAKAGAVRDLRESGDDIIRASNTLMLMLAGELSLTKPGLEVVLRRALDARNAWDNVVSALSAEALVKGIGNG
jgi:hypothetical protein